ncbi:flavodoxin domain-containing protein [Microbacterium sp. BK668]|uniref:flavodoxin domain-containing protein n=1 Tax=Microbacterium sp. BK668 TaxID=2512118 RepID=UPI0010616F2F|nr:flavodoxin domain-containing protein [Microbacterium sp. BK668]TDN91442.1 menaquinone-dependent protoporphyrinogen oxidase [Microbacterium sp. BK668]
MTHILVAYATKHHSTQEIAEAIAAELRSHGHEVDCAEAGHATASGYDAVVLGSAVYMGRWRREAKHFLKHERERLAAIPFWIFSSGPVGGGSGDAEKDEAWQEPKSLMELAESLGVREHVVFGGRLPEHPGNFVESAMVRNTPPDERDNRDWDRIREWTQGVATALAGDRLDA